MTTQNPSADSLKGPSNAELFAAKILTVLREGYHLADLRADLAAGRPRSRVDEHRGSRRMRRIFHDGSFTRCHSLVD
jgi:hypothetical protein